MTKFCIDLQDMMLPDAIAAVLEAWLDAHSEEVKTISVDTNKLDPQAWKNSEVWEMKSREILFSGCDNQWSIGPAEARWTNKVKHPGMSPEKFTAKNKIHLTCLDSNYRQRWILLPFEWSNKNITLIHDWVIPIVDWVEQEEVTLANAYKRVKSFYDRDFV